ncbi:MAG: hypothetical protein WA771_08475 [Chthoniobacterales bacterium]
MLILTTLMTGAIPKIGPEFSPQFQRGVVFSHNHSMVGGYGTEQAAQSLEELKALGVDTVAIVPLGYSFNLEDPRIFGYTGEDLTMTPDGVRRMIRSAHETGLAVTLAPQIWIGMYGSRGDWRGAIQMKSEEDWEEWFANYTEFISLWAQIAREEGVELFSVGSEMRTSTELQPERWRKVIRAVRGVYPGPCTYSANWADEIDFIEFWDQLEYIGISFYFPIGDGNLKERLAEAAKARGRVAEMASKFDKPVILLEAGFRSVPGAGMKPHAWRDGLPPPVDLEEQRLSFEVLFRTFWDEGWFFGFFWWQWFSDPNYAPLPPIDFQFRNKPAAEVLKEFYSQPNPRGT